MDPLSVTASVAGILKAAVEVVNIIGTLKDAPQSAQSIMIEVTHIKIIVSALQKFIGRSARLDAQRAALIQLEDVVAILTQTVLVFSELEVIMKSLSSTGGVGPSGLRGRVVWTWQQTAALRLASQLQQHKTSLSLVLQIMQWSVNLTPVLSILARYRIFLTQTQAKQSLRLGRMPPHYETIWISNWIRTETWSLD